MIIIYIFIPTCFQGQNALVFFFLWYQWHVLSSTHPLPTGQPPYDSRGKAPSVHYYHCVYYSHQISMFIMFIRFISFIMIIMFTMIMMMLMIITIMIIILYYRHHVALAGELRHDVWLGHGLDRARLRWSRWLNFPAVRGCSVFLAKNHRENGAKPKLSFVLWFSILRDMVIFFFQKTVFFFWFTTFSGKWTGTGHQFHRLWIFMAQRVGSYDTIAGWLHELVARKRTKKSKRCGTATIKGWVILRLWVFWVCLEQFSSG